MTPTEGIDIEDLAKELDTRLQALPNPQTEQLRTIRREFSKRLNQTPPQIVLKLALKLLNQHRFVAYELE